MSCASCRSASGGMVDPLCKPTRDPNSNRRATRILDLGGWMIAQQRPGLTYGNHPVTVHGNRMVTRSAARQDIVFRAIADPTRREILRLLRGGSRSVGDLAANFEQSRPAI